MKRMAFPVREVDRLKPKDTEAAVEEMIEGALAESGMEIVDIEFRKENGQWVLRIYIDREDGVDLDVCQRASGIIGGIMDEKDPIASPYMLEVSSPGLDRIIKKDKDFVRFSGHKVKVKAKEQVNGQKNIVGILQGIEGDDIVLDVEKKVARIPRDKVSQVRLVVDFNDGPKNR